jgi:hypothetical protein
LMARWSWNSITVVGSPHRGCPAAPTNGGLSVADGQSAPSQISSS